MTYADRDGSFHTVTDVTDVPDYARGVVRVVDPTASPDSNPDQVYVVDLRQAGGDGRYPTRQLARGAFEDAALRQMASAGPGGGEENPGESGEPSGGSVDPSGNPSGNNPPPVAGKGPIIIYGATWCGACEATKRYLTEKHVPFIEKDVDDPDVQAEMVAKANKAGIPTGSIPIIDVGGHMIVGFNPEQLDALIGEAL